MAEEGDDVSGMGKVGEEVTILFDCQCLVNGKDGKEYRVGFSSHVSLSSMGLDLSGFCTFSN